MYLNTVPTVSGIIEKISKYFKIIEDVIKYGNNHIIAKMDLPSKYRNTLKNI